MTDQQRAGIGIIADRALLRQRLRQTLEDKGFTIAANIPPEGWTESLLASSMVRVWIVDLNTESHDFPHDELLEQLAVIPEVPVFYGTGLPEGTMSAEFSRWKRRLLSKLSAYHTPRPVDIIESEDTKDDTASNDNVVSWPLRPTKQKTSKRPLRPASQVWVLGASLGGPNAVKQFIDALPEDLPVAFVYAQHIDEEFASVLATTIARHSYFDVVEASEGHVLNNGEILMVPIAQRIGFDSRRRLVLEDGKWPGPYSPNIDLVMDRVRECWATSSGAIIFSGMGHDGAIAAKGYQQSDLPVWIQSPGDCASSLMPEGIIEAGCAEYQGTPLELAERLIEQIQSETRESTESGTGVNAKQRKNT